jgi:hypothetical protein
METKPGIESRFHFPFIVKSSWKLGLIMKHTGLIHVLQLASKTGMALAGALLNVAWVIC